MWAAHHVPTPERVPWAPMKRGIGCSPSGGCATAATAACARGGMMPLLGPPKVRALPSVPYADGKLPLTGAAFAAGEAAAATAYRELPSFGPPTSEDPPP